MEQSLATSPTLSCMPRVNETSVHWLILLGSTPMASECHSELQKCNRMIRKRRKLVRTEGNALPLQISRKAKSTRGARRGTIMEWHAPVQHIPPADRSSWYWEFSFVQPLKDTTEALIMATQEQVKRTRSIEAGVYHTRQDPRSRLCKDGPHTRYKFKPNHLADADL